MQGFTFFEPDLFASKVIYGDLGGPLRKDGPADLIKQLDQLVREHRPELLVIDSFKALRDTIRDPLAFREFTSDIAIRLSAWEVTALLVGEYSAEDVREGPEFAIADGILYLYGTEEAEKQKRFLRVMKMRGTPFFAGEHFFEIGAEGITLYPRMAAGITGEYEFPGNKKGSAVAGMTEMLGGGVFESTATLISGGTGSGKTLLALSFLVEAARRGEPGLLVSFEESPRQITRNSQSFGWDLPDLHKRELLDIFHVSPSELNVDRHAFTIRERAEQIGAKMVVIDSITAFEAAVPDLAKYQSHLWAIADYFKRNGVTVIMTTEAKGPFEPLEISTAGVSFIADNIIFLRYVEVGGEIKRVVGVLKMRGSRHDKHLRELLIDPPKIAVGPALEQIGMLGATARR
jgi:circadian clock protein KaiC